MNKLKEHDFPYDSFIGGFYISDEICDRLINFFKENFNHAVPGVINIDGKQTVDIDIKDSLDLSISPYDHSDMSKEYVGALKSVLTEYEKKYKRLEVNSRYGILSEWAIQYYKPGAGFKNWHCERTSNNKRVLAWMTYLNDVPDGGTEFLYQKITSPAKKGLTMFWPTDFTHTHRGQISKDHEKYVTTGWLEYVDG